MIIPLELSESELIAYKDTLYAKAKSGEKDFHSLLEIICCHIVQKVGKNTKVYIKPNGKQYLEILESH